MSTPGFQSKWDRLDLYDPEFAPNAPEGSTSKAHRLHQKLIDTNQTTGIDALRAAQEHHHTTTTNQEKTK